MEDPAISTGPHYPMPDEIWVDDDGRAWGRAVALGHVRKDECTRYVHAPEGSVVLRPGESRKQDRDRLDTLRAQLAHAHLKIEGLKKRIPPEGSVVLSAEEARSLLDGLLEKSPHLRTDKEDALIARLESGTDP